MTQPQPPITRATHTLPFDKLSPRDFERLCLWLVEREGYERAEHLGAAGSEQGRDIVAWHEGALWAFQCKRVQRFGPKDALAEVEKVLALPEDQRPAGLVFLVTCDISANTRQQARARCAGKMECHFWAGTELDEKVKWHPDIVEEFFGNAVRKVFQAVVSPWRLAILTVGLILAFVLAVGIFNIPTLQGLLPTPTAFAPASGDEALIIVAEFDNRSEGELIGVDPSSPTYDFVLRAAQDNPESNVRVERFEQVVTNSRDAQTLGEQYAANLVIWGWYNSLGAQPYVELIGERTIQSEGIVLETPTPMAFYFLNDIPSQSAYLGLFTLGMTHIVVESSAELRQAISFFDAAVSCIVEGTRVKPWEAYMWRANCYGWLGEYEIALHDYDRALYLNPEDAPGYFNRGITHLELGDNEAAIVDCTKAIRIEPDYAEAYVTRSVAKRALGDYEAAIADCNEAIRIRPEYAMAYFNRAIAHSNLGDHEGAIADYTEAIRIKPDDAMAYFNRGAAYAGKGDYDRAIADYTEAIRIKPDDANAYFNRAATQSDLGDHEAAIADYTEVIRIRPEYAMAYFNRAIAHSNLGDHEAAIADYTEVIRIKPDYAEAYFNRAATQSDLGDHEAAIADYTEAIRIKPDDAMAYSNRGAAYAGKGDYDRAIADFDQAIQLQPDCDACTYNKRGIAYGQKGDYDRAIADFHQAIQLQPDYAGAYLNRGLAYKLKGEKEKAIADFEKVLELSNAPDLREQAEEQLKALGAR